MGNPTKKCFQRLAVVVLVKGLSGWSRKPARHAAKLLGFAEHDIQTLTADDRTLAGS